MKPFNQLIAELEVARSLLHERIKNGLSKKVAKFYDDMIVDLQAQILKKKNITNNLAQTISDLKQSLKTPDLRKDFLTLAQNEQDHLLDYNELAGLNLFSSVLPESSIERLVDSAQLEGATVKAWNNGLNADQKKRLERELKIGVSLGETTPMLAQRIAQALEKNKRDATAIALTGAGAIVSEIRQAFFEANDDVIKCYKYQAVLDTRTSELCRAYDGLTWDKDYKPIGHNFPFRKPRVNTHFNCRSTIIPVTKSWDELGIEGMDEASGRTRSSMNGYVPQDMTFNDWLKTQSRETIEKTLGKGRAELFMQGKITMRDLITQQGRALDLSELNLKGGLAAFGKNYGEFYHKGSQAVSKLIGEKSGQVAGAFSKKGLGDIDLIWGDDKIGLKKIINKHIRDFDELGGLAVGLEKIIDDGELVTAKNGVQTIYYKDFKLGLSKGWHSEGENKWIITAYKNNKGKS